ncbi:unnamed protein product [Adineta ricciae]|uniref:Uncharacterized protein n=1 Tax=Adineta ricciae TaxID=249248 RepID=A0A815GCP3_ADIRI|nr:unnamed protein product [Adineta ricciae]CAF1336912.1 unnamed protein product [Adineta ricciae]
MFGVRPSKPTVIRRPSQTKSQQPRARKVSRTTLDLPSSLSSDIGRIFQHVTLSFCRRIIFAPPALKIFVYFFLILLGPFLKDFHVVSNASLSFKTNIFNQHISRIGWIWSIILLVPFVYLTSLIYTRGHYGLISRHLLRLFIATTIWYIITSLFIHIETLTGMCKPINTRGITSHFCRTSRYQWQDGRTYFLLYALLVINEEVKLYNENWKKIEDANKNMNSNPINQSRIRLFSIPITILYLLLAILTILWEFMLLSTVFYLYNILHKLIAACFAVFFWFITYHVWYQQGNGSKFSPCAPGDGLIIV